MPGVLGFLAKIGTTVMGRKTAAAVMLIPNPKMTFRSISRL
jgi:hypothetical protein